MATPHEVDQQLADDLDEITDAQTKAMVAAWALAWSEISTDLLETIEQLLEQGIAITSTTITRSARLAQVLAAIADKLTELVSDAGKTITADLAGVVAQAAAGQAEMIAAQLVRGDKVPDFAPDALPDRRQLAAIVKRSNEQITSLAKPIAPETYEVVRAELIRGVAAGTNPRDTARRMVDRAEDRFNFGLNRAMTISRTETLDAYRNGADAGQQVHAKVLAGWVWLAHLGRRTCRACLSRHGTFHPLSEPGPEGHQQCRCSRGPVVRGADGKPRLGWVPDADEHFASLTKAEQVDLLGIEGWKQWDAGKWPRSEWAVKRENPRWRDSWVQAPAPGGGRGRLRPGTSPGNPAEYRSPAPDRDHPRRGTVVREVKVHQHEIDTAGRLADAGYDVEFLPNPPGPRSADVRMLGRDWDLKSPTGKGPSTIVDRLRAGVGQSDSQVLDLHRSPLATSEADRQVLVALRRYAGLQRVLVLPKDGQPYLIERRA